MESRNKFIRHFAVIFTILYTMMPVVSRAVSDYLTTYFYMAFVVLFLIVVVGKRRKSSLFEYISDILPFLLYGLMTYFVKTGATLLWGYRLMLLFAPIVVGIYVVFYHSDECGLYSKVIAAALIVTCITTINGLWIYPDAARWLATDESSFDAKRVMYNYMNIGGYEFIYSLVLIYPALIYAYKRNIIKKVPAVLIAVLMGYTIVCSQYAIALILFVISSFLFAAKKGLNKRGVIIMTAVSVLLCVVFWNNISQQLYKLGENIKYDELSMRFKALSGGVDGINSSDDNRLELYLRSWNTFLKHPLFGTFMSNGYGTGGHSFILDFLAQFGLAGAVVLTFMYRKIFRLFYKKYANAEGYGFVLWAFVQYVLLGFLNTGFFGNVMALYIPIMLKAVNAKNNPDKHVNNELLQ